MSQRDSVPAFSLVQSPRMRFQSHNGHLPSPAIEILCYLQEHPEAKDTLEGIMVWWLPERAMKYGLPQVRASLALLVGCGYLKKRTLADGHVLYRLNESRPPHEAASRN